MRAGSRLSTRTGRVAFPALCARPLSAAVVGRTVSALSGFNPFCNPTSPVKTGPLSSLPVGHRLLATVTVSQARGSVLGHVGYRRKSGRGNISGAPTRLTPKLTSANSPFRDNAIGRPFCHGKLASRRREVHGLGLGKRRGLRRRGDRNAHAERLANWQRPSDSFECTRCRADDCMKFKRQA
jgi:hypothetical protein